MAGKQVTVTFSQRDLTRLDVVCKRIHLTRQQFIREAVEKHMENFDPFTLAGGEYVDREE